ncbi:MADS-box transcription enhancer factor 2C [Sarotherodon galilaeus]
MVEFAIFKILLILMLRFTAVTQQLRSKVGGKVMLPCVNGKDFHNQYNSTTWLFADSASKTTVTLFEHGQISKENGSKSGRLSVTPKCSLIIKKVRAEDAGVYSCRQFISGQQVSESLTYLFVTNEGDTTKGIITSTTTKNAISANVPKSKSATSTTRTTTSSVTNTSMTSKTNSTTEPEKTSNTVQTKNMLIILAGGFLVLFIILALIGWKRNKRNKRQKSDEMADSALYDTIDNTNKTSKAPANPAADVSYSSFKKTRNKTRVHSNYHKDDAQTFSISGKASNNDNSIYMNMKSIQKARGSYF